MIRLEFLQEFFEFFFGAWRYFKTNQNLSNIWRDGLVE